MTDLTKSGNLFSRIFGGGPKVESLPLHLFGKLPIYKDFISCGLTDDPSKELRDWLSNGFSHRWSVREEYKGADIPLHTFLLHLPESKRFAAGAVWGSEDEGGLRRFPFTLFSILPPGRAVDPLSAADYLSQFEQKALEIRKRVQGGMSLSSFYQAYRGIKLELVVRSPKEVEAGLRAALERTPVSTFANSLFGEDEAPARWPPLLRGLSDHAGNGGAAAVRIPLGERFPAGQQLQFWLLWLRGNGRGGEGVSGLLSQRAGPFARAVLFFRDVRPDDILLLHPERSDYDFVEELAPSAPPPVSTGATQLVPEEEIPTASGAPTDDPDPAAERPVPAGWSAPLLSLLPAG